VFDYLPVSHDVLGIAIADASGHGLPAALIARDVVTGLRTLVGEGVGVDQTVVRLNRVVHRAALARKFISLVFGKLWRDGTFVYCNAGHNAPLLRQAAGARELAPGGPVLGPIADASYQEGRVELAPGDTLVMFTDGVVELEDRDGVPFGNHRLYALIDETAGLRATEIVDSIFAALDRYGAGSPPRDDRTIVVVQRTGPDPASCGA
jgi:sigma-B regulation protein RsbU (phosphoserine phosphatase)